jgi:hypothetical protein
MHLTVELEHLLTREERAQRCLCCPVQSMIVEMPVTIGMKLSHLVLKGL